MLVSGAKLDSNPALHAGAHTDRGGDDALRCETAYVVYKQTTNKLLYPINDKVNHRQATAHNYTSSIIRNIKLYREKEKNN